MRSQKIKKSLQRGYQNWAFYTIRWVVDLHLPYPFKSIAAEGRALGCIDGCMNGSGGSFYRRGSCLKFHSFEFCWIIENECFLVHNYESILGLITRLRFHFQ